MGAPQLADAVSPQTRGAGLLLVPVGSLEQHGPHLPLDTDTAIARAVADAAAVRLGATGVPVWVAPPISIGASGEHQSFAGTLSIGTTVLHQVVVETVRSAATWCPRVVLVNGHGGNRAALVAAAAQLVHEGHDVSWVPCAPPGSDPHAGRAETSLMLCLRPGSVLLEHAEPGDVRPLRETLPQMRVGGVGAVSANGVLGDPTGASAREGHRLLAAMVDALCVELRPGARRAAG